MSELVSTEVGKGARPSRRAETLPPRPNPIGPSRPLAAPVGPRLPKLRAFLGEMLQELTRRAATSPPGAASPLTPAPEPVAARADAPSATLAPSPPEPPPGPPPEPPLDPWEHWLAIRARLSPFEMAVVDTTLGVVKPELQAEWLAGMSVLGVDQAVDLVRSMIPEAPQAPPTAANSAERDSGSGS